MFLSKYFPFPGLVNDMMSILQTMFPVALEEFCSRYSIKAEGMAGGQFNGLNCKRVLEFLEDLGLLLGPSGDGCVKYLQALKDVHHLCVQKELNPNFQLIIDCWKKEFDQMQSKHNMSMTLKSHNWYWHLQEFLASAEGVEATHSKYKTVGKRNGADTNI